MGACCSSTIRDEDEAVSALLIASADDAPRYESRSGTILTRVVDVYDGDTFTALIVQDGRTYRRRCRCIGYDSPEMRGKEDDEKERAVKAREYLKTIIPPGVFPLNYSGTDKYGRLLVSFTVKGGEDLSDHMIRMGHGYKYDGGTKRATASLM